MSYKCSVCSCIYLMRLKDEFKHLLTTHVNKSCGTKYKNVVLQEVVLLFECAEQSHSIT